MNKNLKKPSPLPAPKSGDVLEAAEMVRGTLTMLRQSFGIVFMTGAITGGKFMTELEQKQFAVNFDDLTKDLRACYQCLIDHYQSLKDSESNTSLSDGRLS